MHRRLWNHLTKRRQKQFWLLLVLMILASILEIISIGAVLPFLGVLTSPELVYQHELMEPIMQVLQLTAPDQLLFPVTAIFIMAVIIAALVRLLLLFSITRLSFATGADLSISIYRRMLYKDYAAHADSNSSGVINGAINKTNVVISDIVLTTLTLISSLILFVAITSILFTIDVNIAISASVGFGGLYWVVIFYTRKQLQENSKCIAEKSTLLVQCIQEGLGGIRDILIDGNQEFYCKLYRNADLPLRKASGNNIFISGSPRFVVEALGIILIAVLAYLMSMRENGIESAIPILGALAIGAQRLLPVLQQAHDAYSRMRGAAASFSDVLLMLDHDIPEYASKSTVAPLPFNKDICLENISFRYNSSSSWVLNKFSLRIKKGACVGFVGKTGSGKSTLLDIVMGLLYPTEGKLLVDSELVSKENIRSWQMHVAHVPQEIYLSDNSIKENIAFGVPKDQIDHDLIEEVSRQARIYDLIESWPKKYNTFVGERGVRLSGGQKQRIGIARALYKKANVIIFDEATSALDSETESDVMKAIKGLDKELTILIIAHRITTLDGCDQVIDLGK